MNAKQSLQAVFIALSLSCTSTLSYALKNDTDSRISSRFTDADPHFTAGGLYEARMNNDRFSGEFSALFPFPLQQTNDSTHLPFLNLRFTESEGEAWDSGVGLGYRAWMNDWLLGASLHYDRLNSDNNNGFNYLTIGTEARYSLNQHSGFTFFADAYVPVGNTQQETSAKNQLWLQRPDENSLYNLYYRRGLEQALTGFTTDLGYTYGFGDDNQLEISGYVGQGFFDAPHVETLFAPRATLMVDIWQPAGVKTALARALERVSVETGWRYDAVNKSTWYTRLNVTFGLGNTNFLAMDRLQKRLVDPLRRETQPMIAVFNNPTQVALAKIQPVATVEEIQQAVNAIDTPQIIVVRQDLNPTVINTTTQNFVDNGGIVISRDNIRTINGSTTIALQPNSGNVTSPGNVTFTVQPDSTIKVKFPTKDTKAASTNITLRGDQLTKTRIRKSLFPSP